MTLVPPPPFLYEDLLRAALAEDLGRAGDITTDATVPADAVTAGTIGTRQAGVVAGLPMAMRAFTLYEPRINVQLLVAEGTKLGPGTTLAELSGPARGMLTAERTALNLLGRLSGIATATRSLVEAVHGTGATIVCTRKTTPGLRLLEKYAVRAGGGANHRFGLDDAVLVKDNHVAIAGGVAAALDRVRAHVGHLVKIEIEVDSLDQLDDVLAHGGADVVLLDNFSLEDTVTAVATIAGRLVTEASGGITAERARAIAETGIDLISVGWLTHSAPNLDVGLDL